MSHNLHATAKVDQSAFNYSQASTSNYASSIAQTGQGDDQSVYTYDSRMDTSKFVKTIGDRTYNTLSEVYFLPTDDDEWTRLNKQHVALLVALDGLYAAPDEVRAILAPQQGETKRILDLGCGTGIWTSEMAKEFPHCEVIGVDLAPVPVVNLDVPENCRFEIDDINLGLDHFNGQFDVVHARLIATGLRDFRKTMKDAAECLKPGGIMLWFDADYDMYAADKSIYMKFATEEDTSGSWFQRLIYEMRRCVVNSGRSDLFTMSEELDAGLWHQPAIDPETCKAASLYLPIGPWPEVEDEQQMQRLRYLGSLIRTDLMSAHRAVHGIMKRSGFSEELLQEWSNRADEEMMSLSKPMWIRWRATCLGTTTFLRGFPCAPLPLVSIGGRDTPTSRVAYPYYYIYGTPEQARHETELRNRNKDVPIPPLPILPKRFE